MDSKVREAQLYGAFIKTIRSVGVQKLKSTTLFVRNVDREELTEKKAA